MRKPLLKPPSRCSTLKELRSQIDLLDDELLEKLAKRSEYVRRAVELKPKEQIVDNRRIEAIIARLRRGGDKHNIDPQIVEKIWRALIAAFIEMERKIAEDAED